MTEPRSASDIRPRDRAREFDVVLFGATGFAGELVAEYLAELDPELGVRWAMAGRDLDKLERVRDAIAREHPHVADVPLIVANSMDRVSLDDMASRAEVVCSTVGPYARYGSELVAACVEQQADYCDLTGEVQWVRAMIDAHHDRARERGVRIVHCCGFDSIPSDLGTLVLQQHALDHYGRPCRRVTYALAGARGGFSGGTVASMLNVVEEVARNPQVRKVLADPYSLNPPGERSGPDGRDQMGARYDAELGAWTGPFLMAPVNSRVVRRSNALRHYEYGREFRYREVMKTSSSPLGLLAALGLSVGISAFAAAVAFGPTRQLLEQLVLPAPGEGPSREAIEAGFFKVQLVGEVGDDRGESHTLHAEVIGQRDPGYGGTAVMLAEAALCLALQGDQLGTPGGVLTPASAMGMPLVERLRDAGMTLAARG